MGLLLIIQLWFSKIVFFIKVLLFAKFSICRKLFKLWGNSTLRNKILRHEIFGIFAVIKSSATAKLKSHWYLKTFVMAKSDSAKLFCKSWNLVLFLGSNTELNYRKVPRISPGLIFVSFLWVCWEVLITKGLI